jgi:hypothetical protein
VTASLSILAAAACLPAESDPPDEERRDGIGALGYGAHTMDAVELTEIATAEDGLNGPRDLDFNPEHPGELWIMSRIDDSVTIVFDTGTSKQTTQRLKDPFAMHFMEEVSSISFATGMQFGTCQESRNTYDESTQANDFMGPTLWSADLEVFAKTNPDATDELGFDLGSHLDMLHESPLCMGIAWIDENVYFTFDGLSSTISRYDFHDDHGPGFDDHADGVIERFTEADVRRVPDVPSHLVFDRGSGLLYVADTGNSRIQILDAELATLKAMLTPIEPGTTFAEMEGVVWTSLVAPGATTLEMPSGIALHDDVLYVTDNATSRITAFSLAGEVIDWLDTGLPAGSLMGLRVTDAGIFAVDFLGDRVLRLSAKD